jgi:hypothetical protein
MKRSGRSLKQRLQDISYLPSYIHRARYFRGHGVHSPFVYNIVRKVFMQSKLYTADNALYDELMDKGVAKRRSVQLANLAEHCGYDNWSIDSMEDKKMIIATLDIRHTELEQYAEYARQRGATLCIITPYNNRERWEVCRRIIDAHPSTTVDNRAYLLIFNNHLPKQRFRL